MLKIIKKNFYLAKMGLPVVKIAQAVNMDIDTVQEWLEESLSDVH